MADDDDDNNEPDIELFKKLLNDHGGEWLKQQLAGLKKGLTPPKEPEGGAFSLNELYRELRGDYKTLQEKAEAMAEILTPEQRQLLKSGKSTKGGGLPSPTPKDKNAPPVDPPPKKKTGWL
jgi:hypothetical protein